MNKDLRQTEEYGDYMEAIGWDVVEIKSSKLKVKSYIRKIPFFGGIAKVQRPEKIPIIKQLKKLARDHNLAALYIEPTTESPMLVKQCGFVFSRNSFVPPKTIHIDLTQSEKELFSQVKSKTRYNVRLAQKRGVVVKESTDIETFIKLWHSSARRRKMFLPQKKEIRALWTAFRKNSHLLFASDSSLDPRSSNPLAGVLLVYAKDVGYYMYAASTKEGNKLFAPTFLAWEAIRLAKRKKCKIFDFEGIHDDRYPETKNWKGFTRFKEGFGGKIITYPKSLVKYYNPIIRLFRL